MKPAQRRPGRPAQQPPPPGSFAAKLRRQRGQRTYVEAAAMLGVSVRSYQNWEQNRNVPDPFKQKMILETLYLASIPGMRESIRAGMAEPITSARKAKSSKTKLNNKQSTPTPSQ